MSKNIHGQETGKVRVELDFATLGEYIERNSNLFNGPWKAQQFKLGQSNPTFLMIDSKGSKCIVRKKPPGSLLSKTAHAIEREYLVLSCLQRTAVPVPKVYGLCHDESLIGTSFYFMEFVHGRIFSDTDLPTIKNISDKRLCYFSIIKTLVRLHEVPWKKIGLRNYGKEGGYYSRQIENLIKISKIQAAVQGPDGSTVGELHKLAELEIWMNDHLIEDEVSLVHGDYKTDNIIFHESNNEVIGLLDWELSTIGHPLSDLANLLLPWYIPYSIKFGSFSNGYAGAPRPLRVPEADEMISLYCNLRNRPIPKDWIFCIVFAFFRLSVIAQGIAARLKRNQASSSYADKIAQLFGPISYLAHSIAYKSDSKL